MAAYACALAPAATHTWELAPAANNAWELAPADTHSCALAPGPVGAEGRLSASGLLAGISLVYISLKCLT